jgi:hypothetical protein
VQTANQRVTDAWQKDPYDAAARYSEGVTALPAIDWQSNTAPQVLAAKVAQQNTIRADQNMGAFSVLRPGESQSLAATLVNGDPKQGSQILRTLADTLPPDIYRATVSDAPVKAALDGMVRSYDPDRLNTAFSVLDRAYRADPVGFKATFGDATMGRLQTWQAHKDSLSPMQMSEYFKRADDPAFATARKVWRRRPIQEDQRHHAREGVEPARALLTAGCHSSTRPRLLAAPERSPSRRSGRPGAGRGLPAACERALRRKWRKS